MTQGMHMDEPDLRASDAERSATVDLLRRHHAEGRIDTTELEERIERCYAAKTRGELDALTADLPGPRRRRRSGQRSSWIPLPFVLLPLIAAIAITTHGHALWLLWPLAFFMFFRLRWRVAHARSSSRRPR
jgi:Domain of unknown function (DUF1707)